jgi:hypothetical protein
VTVPKAFTVATAGRLDCHVTGHPPGGVGPTVPSSAENVAWSPTIIVAVTGDTATEFTHGCGTTVTTAVAVCPPADAATEATPTAFALIAPAVDTTTTEVSLDFHATIHPPAGGVPVVVKVAVRALESPTTNVVD